MASVSCGVAKSAQPSHGGRDEGRAGAGAGIHREGAYGDEFRLDQI